MKPYRIFTTLLLFFVGLSRLDAGNVPEKENHAVSFAYDVDFDMNFDNREFARSRFTPSMTIFAARLTPALGLSVSSPDGTLHKVMAGVDVMKDFGSQEKDVLGEVSLYYKLDKKIGRTGLTMYAGVFPRKTMSDRYSEAFFSDSLRFYDNNLEGLLLQLRRPSASFEFGCDWYGRYSQQVREKFMLFSSGEGKVAPVLSLGYALYVCHFAGSKEVKGVVDNILANPYARFDFGHLVGLQTFSVRLGWLQAMQNDRRNIGIYTFPFGGELDVTVRNWNVSVENSLFYGKDMMPYYNMCDAGGYKYGNNLYLGDPFYRVHDDANNTRGGLYDRLDVMWNPYLCDFVQISVGARFHFNDFRYSGCRQIVKVAFNLSELMKIRRK